MHEKTIMNYKTQWGKQYSRRGEMKSINLLLILSSLYKEQKSPILETTKWMFWKRCKKTQIIWYFGTLISDYFNKSLLFEVSPSSIIINITCVFSFYYSDIKRYLIVVHHYKHIEISNEFQMMILNLNIQSVARWYSHDLQFQ